jgi:hypothetical protein
LKRILTGILISTLLLTIACLPKNQEKVSLRSGGYGYVIADIVLIDTEKTPEIGDIVLYDAIENGSYGTAFGPGVHLSKIIGQPGNKVTFINSTYKTNGYQGPISDPPGGISAEQNVMWGIEKYDNSAFLELTVPDSEFLADDWLGRNCVPNETNEDAGSVCYNRYTIKQKAIIGVVLKKLGHDNKLEEELKGTLY